MDKSDFFMLGWIFLLYVWFIITKALVPPPYDNVVMMMGFGLLIGGLWFQDLYFRDKTNPYPYLETTLRPSEKKIHIYYKDLEAIKNRPLHGGLYASRLPFAFPIMLEGFSKVNQCIVVHKGLWETRIKLRPGTATYLGNNIRHPQTAKVTFYTKETGTVTVEKATPIPVFQLHDAPGDYYMPETVFNAALKGLSSDVKVNFQDMEKKIENLNHKLALKEAECSELTIKVTQFGESWDASRSETQGLLGHKTDIKKMALEFMLTIRESQLTIVNAIKALSGPKLPFTKWIALTILGICGFAYMMANPEITTSLRTYLSQPANQIWVLAIFAITGILVYYATKGKRR